MTSFQEGALTLELAQSSSEVRVEWSGRSTAREPGRFILPVLTRAVELCDESRRPLVLDFRRIEYMNSSTITPVIRTLEQARRSSRSIRVLYQKTVKWQELSFSALQVFETPDRRIEICRGCLIAELQPVVVRGTLESAGARHPVRVDRADAHSLVVSFDDRGLLPNGTRRYERMTLTLGGQELQLGSCVFDAARTPVSKRPDGGRDGDGRVLFEQSVYDFRQLLRSGRVSELAQRVRQLPVVLSRQASVSPAFRALVSRILYDLQVFRALFDDLDRNLQLEPLESREQVRELAVEQHFDVFRAFFDTRLRELDEQAKREVRDAHQLHGFFLRKQMWDIIATSDFLLRTNLKPRGYAGDSAMMRMIYENTFVGQSVFARFMHRHPIVTDAAQAVRNRCQIIADAMARSARQVAPRRARVLSVACGPAWELRAALAQPADFERYQLVLLDQDLLALEEARATVTSLEERASARTELELRRESVRTMLGSPDLAARWGRFDLIYSMGMFDYLTRPVAIAVLRKLYEQLLPGGTMLIGNFHPDNPTRTYMEYWMDWVLCYRDEAELAGLAASLPGATVECTYEPAHCQLFLEVKRT